MRSTFFTILFLSISINSLAQLKPARVVLKSGDTIKGIIGKIKSKTFKYKTTYQGDSKEIHLSKIASLEIRFSEKQTLKYAFFKKNGSDNFLAVHPIILKGRIKLYYKSNGNNYGHLSSMNMISSNSNNFFFEFNTILKNIDSFYVRKDEEDFLFYLGYYENYLKFSELVKLYFKDCPKLIDKIKIRKLV